MAADLKGADLPGAVQPPDPDLINGWGLARSPTSPWWVADNGPDKSSSKSTLYTGTGAKVPLTVNVLGGPTGAVFAGVAGSFQIGTATDPTLGDALFIFATENGDLSAWRGGSDALVAVVGDDDVSAVLMEGAAVQQPDVGLVVADQHPHGLPTVRK